MKLSQSTFLYFNYPLEEAIKRLSLHGYEGVEIWGGRPHAYYKDISEKKASYIRGLIEKYGLEISAFIPAQFRYPTCLCSPDQGVRKDSVQYLKDSMVTSLRLGCNKVSLCPGHTLYGQGYKNGMEQLIESLKELLEFAAGKNVVLYMEPAHRFESDLIVTVEDGVRLINEMDADNLGIVMDTGHCFINKESLVDCVSMVKDIPFHIHLDDNRGFSDDHMIPGEGNICFVPFLQSLKKSGYQGFLTAELGWGYTIEPDTAAYKNRTAVKYLLDKI
ncbi:sugar phosphate isomerase/epimerase [candidate division KSB1 bacterium]|nr:sugar phosphate isomerase/epimerase [candidate division KSB1 bacterium]